MSIWVVLGIVCLAGALGGLVNSFFSEDSPKKPTKEGDVFILGFISHILLGAVAAGLSWALYGPASQATVAVIGTTTPVLDPQSYSLTLSALAGAVLIGMGGANWIANQINKKATTAASTNIIKSNDKVTPEQLETFQSMLASPVDALAFAKGIGSQASSKSSEADRSKPVGI